MNAEVAAEQMKVWYPIVSWVILLLSLIGHVLKTLVLVVYIPLLSVLAVGMLAYCIVTLVAWRKRRYIAILLFRIYLLVNFVFALGFMLLFYSIPGVLLGTLLLTIIPFGFYLAINKKKYTAERVFFVN